MPKKITLLLIDPQRSFAAGVDQGVPDDPKEQQKVHDGELYVAGAWDSFVKAANLIDRVGDGFYDIQATMDSHHLLHISHPLWYSAVTEGHGINLGDGPLPFTVLRNVGSRIIGSRTDDWVNWYDVNAFTTRRRGLLNWTLSYLDSITTGGRYPHTIWAPHCLIGTRGQTFVEPIQEALLNWSLKYIGYPRITTKGSNPKCEHFSALKAEVPDPKSPEETGVNSKFISTLMEADLIVLGGVAGDICLANTIRDTANEFFDPNDASNQSDEFIKKCVLLTDVCASVNQQRCDEFIAEMTARGMQITTTADFLA